MFTRSTLCDFLDLVAIVALFICCFTFGAAPLVGVFITLPIQAAYAAFGVIVSTFVCGLVCALLSSMLSE